MKKNIDTIRDEVYELVRRYQEVGIDLSEMSMVIDKVEDLAVLVYFKKILGDLIR